MIKPKNYLKLSLLFFFLTHIFAFSANALDLSGTYFSVIEEQDNGLLKSRHFLQVHNLGKVELKFHKIKPPKVPIVYIKVSGKYISEDIFQVSSLYRVRSKTTSLQSPKTKGGLKVAMALVDVKDSSGRVHHSIYDKHTAHSHFQQASTHLYESSFGQSYYLTSNGDYGDGYGEHDIFGPYEINLSDLESLDCDSYDVLETRALDALRNQVSDFETYDSVVLAFPRHADCSWGGRAVPSCMGRVGGIDCLVKLRVSKAATLAHELGHNFGFNHAANDLNNDLYRDNGTFYGDVHTIMGSYLDEDRNIKEDLFIAPSLEKAKWISENNGLVKEISANSFGVYKIKARSLGDKTLIEKEPVALKIKASDGSYLYLSYNVLPGSYYEGSNFMGLREVLVHSFRPFEYQGVVYDISYNAKVFDFTNPGDKPHWPNYLNSNELSPYNPYGYFRFVHADDETATIEYLNETPRHDSSFCELLSIGERVPFSIWRPSWKACEEEYSNDTSNVQELICVDEDGDGWGWNGQESCKVEETLDAPSTSFQEALPLQDKQDKECVDEDGDGWGWDGERSCKVGESLDSKPIALEESAPEIDNQDKECIDEDGDGWGWDGEKSCIVK